MVPLNTFNVVAATFLHTLDYRDLLYVHVVRLLLRFCICLTQLTMRPLDSLLTLNPSLTAVSFMLGQDGLV